MYSMADGARTHSVSLAADFEIPKFRTWKYITRGSRIVITDKGKINLKGIHTRPSYVIYTV